MPFCLPVSMSGAVGLGKRTPAGSELFEAGIFDVPCAATSSETERDMASAWNGGVDVPDRVTGTGVDDPDLLVEDRCERCARAEAGVTEVAADIDVGVLSTAEPTDERSGARSVPVRAVVWRRYRRALPR